jgi:hypothetical protein
MRATIEALDESVRVSLIDATGSPTHVILGGADGVLITIDSAGRIHVLPPEGPGPTELQTAFASLRASVAAVGSLLVPCFLLEQEMASVERAIIEAEQRHAPTNGLIRQLSELQAKYRAEHC